METSRDLVSPLKERMNLEELRYACVWEDAKLLAHALKIESNNHVVSIGSAGCNSLYLLAQNPRKLTIIDLSPAQISFIKNKILALREMDYETYREFVFSQIQSGRLEKFFGAFRSNFLKNIFTEEFKHCLTLEKQIQLLNKVDWQVFARETENYFSFERLAKLGRDPAQMDYVTEKNPGKIFFQKFKDKVYASLITQNPYLYCFIFGEFNETVLPDYLNPNLFETLKRNLDKIEILQTDVESYLTEANPSSLDKFNLSDIFEYVSPEHANRIFDLLSTRLAPSGRLAYWTLLVPRISNHPKLKEVSTSETDRLWFYDRFMVYENSPS